MQTALQKPNAFAIGLNISIILVVSRRGFSVSNTASVSRTGFHIKLTELTVTVSRIWVFLYRQREVKFWSMIKSNKLKIK